MMRNRAASAQLLSPLGGDNPRSGLMRRFSSDSDMFRDAGDFLEDEEPSPRHDWGGHGDLLAVARSIADKFLIRCLLDDALRPIYSSTEGLMRLKVHGLSPGTSIWSIQARIVEALLLGLRSGACTAATRISLETHRGLSTEHLNRLTAHLESAAREHALLAEGSSRLADAQELAKRLASVPSLPLALLPDAEKNEAASTATAMYRKGGDDAGKLKVLGGLELAPLRVPIKRRRQMFGCLVCCSALPGTVAITAFCVALWRKTWPLLVSYLPWALFFDRAPWTGGRKPWPLLRQCWIIRQFAAYFPASLIKSDPGADFSGTRPMLMGYHPHGILSFGAACNFGSDATGWAEKFPGLVPRICTLNLSMKLPFLRELLSRLGFIAAAQEAVKAALRPGNIVILVVGGAAEALDTKPGEYVLTLKRRSGFFRLALQHGADLVPSFGFGENDIFETVKESGSLLYKVQQRMYKWLSFSTPVFYGRNVFSYNMGPLPYRRPLTTVVGKPIRVEKNECPTPEDVEELRQKYIGALRGLYDEWQPRLEPGRETPLIIV